MNTLQDKPSAAINQHGFIDTLITAYTSWDSPSSICKCNSMTDVRKITLFFCHLFLVLLPFNWHCLLHKLYFIKDSFTLVNPFSPLSLPFSKHIVSEQQGSSWLCSFTQHLSGWNGGLWFAMAAEQSQNLDFTVWHQRYLQAASLKFSFRNS